MCAFTRFVTMLIMQKLHTADDPIFIGYLRSLLEAEGIACNIRNELLIGGSGELPPNECWPEIWVLNDDDFQRATAIVDKARQNPRIDDEPWQCTHCHESSEAQFTACWQCGTIRD